MRSTSSKKLQHKRDARPPIEFDFFSENDFELDLRLRTIVADEIDTIAQQKVNYPSLWRDNLKIEHQKHCQKAIELASKYVIERMKKFDFLLNDFALIPSLSSSIEAHTREPERIIYRQSCPPRGFLAEKVHEAVELFWDKIRDKGRVALHELVQRRKWNLGDNFGRARLPFFILPSRDNKTLKYFRTVDPCIFYATPLDDSARMRLASQLEAKFSDPNAYDDKDWIEVKDIVSTENFQKYVLWLIVLLQMSITDECKSNVRKDLIALGFNEEEVNRYMKLVAASRNIFLCDIVVCDELTNIPLGSIAVVTKNKPIYFHQAREIHDIYFQVFDAINKLELQAYTAETVDDSMKSMLSHQIVGDYTEWAKSYSESDSNRQDALRIANNLGAVFLSNYVSEVKMYKSDSNVGVPTSLVREWVEKFIRKGGVILNNLTVQLPDTQKLPMWIALISLELLRNAKKYLNHVATKKCITFTAVVNDEDNWQIICESGPHNPENIEILLNQIKGQLTSVSTSISKMRRLAQSFKHDISGTSVQNEFVRIILATRNTNAN